MRNARICSLKANASRVRATFRPPSMTRRPAKTATLCLALIALIVPSSPIASPAVLQPNAADTTVANSTTSTTAMVPLADLPEIILQCDEKNCSDIQIASDLHVEFLAGRREPGDLDELITPSAPILALLGDIGNPMLGIYREFLLMQAKRFKAVLVLSGNHEYYSLRHSKHRPQEGGSWRTAKERHTSVEDIAAAISKICEEHPALHYVDNRVVRLGHGTRAPALLCTPLWSHVPPDAMDVVGRSLNDYQKCYVRNDPASAEVALPAATDGLCSLDGEHSLRQLSPADTSRWHSLAVAWLQREIARLKSVGVPSIGVLTHHTPSMQGTSHPRFEGSNAGPVQHAFSTNLAAVYETVPELVLWAYGHTHYNNDRTVGTTRFISNQRGYYPHEVNPDYCPKRTVRFGDKCSVSATGAGPLDKV